ncbi:MAG: LamG-like jellyroll fold domain-containing protein [Kiritimatiellia bacterium]
MRVQSGFRMRCRVRFNRLREGARWTNVAVKGVGNRMEYILRVDPAAEGGGFAFFLNIDGSLEPRVRSGEAVHAGVWYDVSAGWNGTNLWIEVNGDRTEMKRCGMPAHSGDPLMIGPFDGAVDELEIVNPAARCGGVACWPFDGTLTDISGNGHDALAAEQDFDDTGCGRQALRTFPGSVVRIPHAADISLAPGLNIQCSFLFDELPENYCAVLKKDGEYMLRLGRKGDAYRFSFFVYIDNNWEIRCANPCRIETGKWYDVAARWTGSRLYLDVNGERADVARYGKPGIGSKPLKIGAFKGMVDNLSIENPRLPLLSMVDMQSSSALPQAGRIEEVFATVCNYGSDAASCSVELKIPEGVECVSSRRIDLGDMPSGCERRVAWKLRTEKSLAADLNFDLNCRGEGHSSVEHQFAVFPEDISGFEYNMKLPPERDSADAEKTVYYIDPSGGDNQNDGKTPQKAWKDFTPINGGVLGPGECLLIRRGCVVNQELRISAEGTADAWAEIGSYGEGARPLIRRNKDISERCALIINPDYLHTGVA